MVLRKGRLRRPCIRCGELFEPLGRFSRICDNCRKVKGGEWLLKLCRQKKDMELNL